MTTVAAVVLVLLAASSADAVTIPWETRTGHLSSGPYGWTYSYDIGVVDGVLMIEVDVALVGARVDDRLRSRWESGIEDLWSTDRFLIPIRFNVDWVAPSETPDYVVRVNPGFGYWDLRTWYRTGASGWGDAYQEEVAAHEYGHMISLWDEYAGGAVDPRTGLIDTGGLMHTLDGPTLDHYYETFLTWYELHRPDEPAPVPEPVPFVALVAALFVLLRTARAPQADARRSTAGSILRDTSRPSRGSPCSRPSDTTTLPRRIVVTGQPLTFHPSHGE